MPTPDSDPTYHCIDPEDIEPTPDHPCKRRSISETANLSMLAASIYELEPGEQLPRTYHYHEQREELFYIRAGALHVETPTQEFVLDTDQVFVAEPNSPHRAYNPDSADESTVVLGVGAPRSDIAYPFDADS